MDCELVKAGVGRLVVGRFSMDTFTKLYKAKNKCRCYIVMVGFIFNSYPIYIYIYSSYATRANGIIVL